jgi:hypothetical protein
MNYNLVYRASDEDLYWQVYIIRRVSKRIHQTIQLFMPCIRVQNMLQPCTHLLASSTKITLTWNQTGTLDGDASMKERNYKWRVLTNEECLGKLIGVMWTNALNHFMKIFQSFKSQPNHLVDCCWSNFNITLAFGQSVLLISLQTMSMNFSRICKRAFEISN